MPPCQQSSLVDKHPLSCEEPTHWKRSDSLEKTPMLGKTKGRRRKGQQRIRWLDGIPDSVDMHLSKLGNSEGQGSLACCSPWGHQESDMTEQLNNISCPSVGEFSGTCSMRAHSAKGIKLWLTRAVVAWYFRPTLPPPVAICWYYRSNTHTEFMCHCLKLVFGMLFSFFSASLNFTQHLISYIMNSWEHVQVKYV